jgi:site-specific DNA-cytosine methylase
LRAVDCQSFAGGFSLGVVQAGFELVAKREFTGGFGVPAMEGNRRLLGYGWETQASDAADWEPVGADLVFGNPPCSGFSGLSVAINVGGVRGDWRGVDNPINNCMWSLVHYAARCRAETVVFESVQQAGRNGRQLMQALRDHLEGGTGKRWGLWHVFHNNLSVGGVSMRKRYFFVASRHPFSVNRGQMNLATLRDAIGDLEPAELGSVEGHVTYDTPRGQRLAWMARNGWRPGEQSSKVMERLGGRLPDRLFVRRDGSPFSTDLKSSPYNARRWSYDEPARVLTGYGLVENVHPTLPRTFTHREAARILGYPDGWRCEPYVAAGSRGISWWGKGIPVGSGRWVAAAALASLKGHTLEDGGEEVGDREYLIDVTNDWRPARPPETGREPAELTGEPRGRNGRLIAAYLARYPTAEPADVAGAVGCSVGRVHEALQGRG